MKIDIKKFAFQSEKIFESLSEEEEKVFILDKYEKFFFKKGKLIFYEEGIPTGVFFIKSGKAKIFKTGLDTKEQIFYIYKKGDMLGYHALLCNEKYEESCQALEECEVQFNYISIPLQVQYTFGRGKLKYFADAGVKVSLLQNSKGDYASINIPETDSSNISNVEILDLQKSEFVRKA